MCGRYYIEADDMPKASAELFARMEKQMHSPLPVGEIFPTQGIPVFVPGGAEFMRWGFQLQEKRCVINARSESAETKAMFREHLQTSRVIIPASGFYEWKRTGEERGKYAICHRDQPMMMAGLARTVHGKKEVVILTREALGAMKDIHDRQPLLFSMEQARQWIARRTEKEVVCALLKAVGPEVIFHKTTV